MIHLLKRIWNAEPVVLVGSLASSWTAIVAFDQVDDSWMIYSWVYIVAVPLMAFLTTITRRSVSPVE